MVGILSHGNKSSYKKKSGFRTSFCDIFEAMVDIVKTKDTSNPDCLEGVNVNLSVRAGFL